MRASRTHTGQSESVSRGQPSGGFTFCHDFSNGFSDQLGVNPGFCLILFNVLNTTQAPLAATEIPFSTYFTGRCMRKSRWTLSTQIALNDRRLKGLSHFLSSERAVGRLNGRPNGWKAELLG